MQEMLLITTLEGKLYVVTYDTTTFMPKMKKKPLLSLGGGCFIALPLAVCDEQVLPRWESQAQTTLS